MKFKATLFLSTSLILSGCGEVQTIGTAIGIPSSTLGSITGVLNTVYTDGQLFCTTTSGVVGVVDATTGQAYTVTNKPAATVSKVCNTVYPGSFAVDTPGSPSSVPVVTVVPPVS